MIVKKPEKKNVATNGALKAPLTQDPPRVEARVEPSTALPPKILLLTDKQKAEIAMLNKLMQLH
jgi:hypothetical protein